MNEKHVPGEKMPEHQLAYSGGKLSFQKQQALRAKEMRRVIAQFPGITTEELRNKLHPGIYSPKALSYLEHMKLVKRKGNVRRQYWAVPMENLPSE